MALGACFRCTITVVTVAEAGVTRPFLRLPANIQLTHGSHLKHFQRETYVLPLQLYLLEVWNSEDLAKTRLQIRFSGSLRLRRTPNRMPTMHTHSTCGKASRIGH